MSYIRELLIILLVSFIGELLHYFIPLPIPSSVYGLVLMFLLLCFKIVKIEHVKSTSKFLINIMPIMFIPAGVSLLSSIDSLKNMLLPIIVITIISTILVMVVTGLVAKLCSKKKEGALDE